MERQDRDDTRIAAVFTAAAEAAPPPSFGHADVVAASRRARARRRSALVGGAVAVLAVAGIGSAFVAGAPGDEAATSAAAPAPAQADAAPEAASAPGDTALRDGPVPLPPLGPGDAECADRQDPALRALLEQVLPEVAAAPEAAITMECRPGGERGVNLEVTEGGVTGVLTVEYLPPGTEPRPVDPEVAAARLPTASGGTVSVYSGGIDGADPFADRLDLVAAHLAPRL